MDLTVITQLTCQEPSSVTPKSGPQYFQYTQEEMNTLPK